MPSVLTCVVAKRLYEKPTDDHWAVRDAAADVVADICRKFSTDYQKLQVGHPVNCLARTKLSP